MSSRYTYVKKAIKERKAWIDREFKSRPCERCGKQFPPYAMDFHHRDPRTKLFTISYGAFRYSRKRVVAEVAKCALLCAVCHRIVEYEESGR